MKTKELARSLTLLGSLGFDLEIARRSYMDSALARIRSESSIRKWEDTEEDKTKIKRRFTDLEKADFRSYRNLLLRTRDTLRFLEQRATELADELKGSIYEDGSDEEQAEFRDEEVKETETTTGDKNAPEAVQ